jgi:hypothetical protein
VGADDEGLATSRADAARWAADPADLARCRARWREAESRLYRLVLTSPELYETSLRLVRAVADELRAVTSEADLVALDADGTQVLDRVSRTEAGDLSMIDTAAVVAAGFSLRHAELVAAHDRDVALQRVQLARAAGRPWVTLHESGVLPTPGQLGAGYHLVEGSMQVPWGVHASATYDLDSATMVYLVEPVAVDVTDASWWVPDDAPVPTRTCADVAAWQEALTDVRERLTATRPHG